MPVTIQSRLVLLVLCVLLPGLAGMAWLITSTVSSERAANARMLRDTSRALSMVVDRELSQRVALARLLAQSRWLDAGGDMTAQDLAGFRQLAARALDGMDGWVELRAVDGTLLDTRDEPGGLPGSAPGGAPGGPPGSAPAQTANRALLTQPQVQRMQPAAVGPDSHAAMVQPVQRGGRTVLNVVLALRPPELQRIVDAQALPPGWYGTVLDSGWRVVARYPGGSAFLGRTASADLQARLASSREGAFESVSLDGQPTSGYYATSALGWTYVAAMPRAAFSGWLPQAAWQVGLGALALLALAMGGVFWVTRSIVQPVHALRDAALRLRAGQPVPQARTGLAECDEVAQALAAAADAVACSRADLETQVAQAVVDTQQAAQRVSKSQRVEALGRLTGGVAHDFNNLLGVISNSAHLMQRHPAAAELEVPLAATVRAVERGSLLTQHLLRFAGQRPVRPRPLALGRWLPELHGLLHSVLGRMIELRIQVAPDTAPVQVDSSELELALVNLALNARDAMPAGGELRLAARNAQAEDGENLVGRPGCRYVLITVGDDGVGLQPEQAAQAFEPFFTTKSLGQGSGLGLSQVHGFCVQAGGLARLNSTPGLGTTVSLLLPAIDALPGPDELAATGAEAEAGPDIAGARVLLVEDNEELGTVTAALLTSHGATVERVGNAEQALQRLGAATAFDVVLSDVVMLGPMDGLALALRLRRTHPQLPVVLISGYNTTAAKRSDFVLLRKPCPPRELIAALCAAIAGPVHDGGAGQAR